MKPLLPLSLLASVALSGCAVICNSAGNAGSNAIARQAPTPTPYVQPAPAGTPPAYAGYSGAGAPPTGGMPDMSMLSGMMAKVYATILGTAFGAYEGEIAYRPGEWTRFDSTTQRDPSTVSTLERAFLFVDKGGNEYWRVKFTNGKNNSVIVIEGEFDAGHQKLLKMRVKNANQEPQDIAVTDQTYTPPQKMTRESLNAMLVGSEQVTVPAGTYPTKHYKITSTTSPGVSEVWMTAGVPGGQVKYTRNGDNGSGTGVLRATGTGAVSELGMKPDQG